MLNKRIFALAVVAVTGVALVAWAQTGPTNSAAGTPSGWRAPSALDPSTAPGAAPISGKADAAPARPVAGPPRTPIAHVTNGSGTLPNDHGQVWREYDISPYTLRVTSTNRPEQAIVDWILRETKYETWHSEPLGLLSADHRTLRVYHTPQMQAVVGEIVDRFVNGEAETQAFGMHIITLTSPNWRAKSQRILHPVATQSQGIQAWLISKEDKAMLMADLRKRTDYREHSSSHLLVNNGQSAVINNTTPKNYVRNVTLKPDTWPGYEPEIKQIDEGFSIEFNPLLSLDGKSVDAVIKCNIDQVEKLVPVVLDVPTAASPRQHTQIDVPQISSCRLHEKFHWPTDQVLLISVGVVATPAPTDTSALKLPLVSSPPRAELLIFIESKGAAAKTAATAGATSTAQKPAQSYNGRY